MQRNDSSSPRARRGAQGHAARPPRLCLRLVVTLFAVWSLAALALFRGMSSGSRAALLDVSRRGSGEAVKSAQELQELNDARLGGGADLPALRGDSPALRGDSLALRDDSLDALHALELQARSQGATAKALLAHSTGGAALQLGPQLERLARGWDVIAAQAAEARARGAGKSDLSSLRTQAAALERASSDVAARTALSRDEESEGGAGSGTPDGAEGESDVVRYVDVRRGTLNLNSRAVSRGNVLPVMTLPLGMNHWTVVNQDKRVAWFFHPESPRFAGVRCSHQPSPWIGDYAYFDVLPFFDGHGEPPGAAKHTYDVEGAEMGPSHLSLSVDSQCTGWWLLFFGGAKSCLHLELAATAHGAQLRIRFPPGSQRRGLQLRHLEQLEVEAPGAGRLSDNAFSFSGRARDWAVMNRSAVAGLGMWVAARVSGEALHEPQLARGGSGVAGSVTWSAAAAAAREAPDQRDSGVVLVRIGTSFISREQALLALERETSAPFDEVQRQGRAAWQRMLGRVAVTSFSLEESEALERKTMLYTCLYRALLFPRQLGETDASGSQVHYSPYDGKGATYAGPLSTDSGFWDAYISVYPFLHLVYPDLAAQVLEGWVNAIREDPGRMLAQWASPGRVGSMVGAMGEVSMAEAIVNGALGNESAREAYDYLVRSATAVGTTNGRAFLDEYIRLGFVPHQDKRSDEVALSQNYYLADHCVSLVARRMGNASLADALRARSLLWPKLFDQERQFFVEKNADGATSPRFNEFAWMGPYTEGGPWQYRFYVPHDPQGLRRAYAAANNGDPNALCAKLNEMMTAPNTVSIGHMIHEALELKQQAFGQYAHNNQPVHHVLYLFAHAGCPLDGQKWLHRTLTTLYGPKGFSGDEDNGEMASWYVLSSFGLFALVPGSGEYQLGAPPLFDRVTVRRPASLGGTLRISKKAQATTATRAVWNGVSVNIASDAKAIPYRDLLRGGDLVFEAA